MTYHSDTRRACSFLDASSFWRHPTLFAQHDRPIGTPTCTHTGSHERQASSTYKENSVVFLKPGFNSIMQFLLLPGEVQQLLSETPPRDKLNDYQTRYT